MPVCTVCESEEFDERDGLYYCQICMTQSQDYRREEEAEDGGTYCISSQLIKKSKKDKKQKMVIKGRPWHTYEGFTIIIREQVKALIKLGASPLLKDVVLRLWCNYLSKTGIAFPEDESKMDNFMQKHQRGREQYPASLKCPDIVSVKYIKTWRKRYGMSNKTAKKHNENTDLATKLQDIEFYEGDNPVEEVKSDESELNDSSEEEEDAMRLRRGMRNQVEWMNMVKTLCFCYIGMLYTDNLVTVSDLVRWASHNKIPFYRASMLIPDDMRFNTYDYSAFHANLLKYEHIEVASRHLVKYLQLTDLPMVSLSAISSKYIVMLDLPGEIHGFVSNLIQPNDDNKMADSIDLLAMAYIISVLQLLLGIDDSTERELSNIALKLNTLFSNRYNMFVWSDWTAHINKKILITGSPDMFDDPRNVKETKTFLENFIFFEKDRKSGIRKRTYKSLGKEVQDALLRPLETLQKSLQSSSVIQTSTEEIDVDDTEMEYNPMLEPTLADSHVDYCLNPEKELSTEKEMHIVSSKLRSSSFKFITQPLTFQEDLERNFSVQNSSSCDSDDGEEYFSGTDLFDEPPPKKTKRKSSNKSMNFSGSIMCDQSDKDLLLGLVNKLSDIQECSSIFNQRKEFTDLMYKSKAYQWLIRVCASMLACSTERLNLKVMELQRSLFSDWKEKVWNRKNKLLSLLNK